MKRHYKEMVLVDISPGMLAMSRALNPELEHHEGDMRTVRLGRQFDAVFVHDAVCYMTTETDLQTSHRDGVRPLQARRCGIVLPRSHPREFRGRRPTTVARTPARVECDGYRGNGSADPDDTTYFVDYAYLLRESDGAVRVVYDRTLKDSFRATRGCSCSTMSDSHTRRFRSSTPISSPASTRCFSVSGPKPRAGSRYAYASFRRTKHFR